MRGYQQGAGSGDEPQERCWASGQIHQGFLAGQRPLPGDQESDVLVQPATEAR